MNIHEALENYITSKPLADSTEYNYRNDIGRFVDELKIMSTEDLKALSPQDYVSYTRSMLDGYASSSVNNAIRSIDAFLGHLYDEYLLDNDELFGKKLNHGSRRKKFYPENKDLREPITQEEYEKMLSVCRTDQDTLTLKVLRYTAARSSEVARMKFSEIQKGQDGYYKLMLTKTKNGDRWAVFSKELYDEILVHMLNRKDGDDYIFTSTRGQQCDGGGVSSTTIYNRVKSLAKLAFPSASKEYMKKFHPHNFRATTFSVILQDGGATLEQAASVLGDGIRIAKERYSRRLSEPLYDVYSVMDNRI